MIYSKHYINYALTYFLSSSLIKFKSALLHGPLPRRVCTDPFTLAEEILNNELEIQKWRKQSLANSNTYGNVGLRSSIHCCLICRSFFRIFAFQRVPINSKANPPYVQHI